jgi:hypothetical protein
MKFRVILLFVVAIVPVAIAANLLSREQYAPL